LPKPPKLDSVDLDMLGTARKVISSKENTTIVGGKGKKADIEKRISQIRNLIGETDSEFDREKLEERLAKLSGGVAVIRVGAATEVEQKEKQHRIEDAVSATKAAIEEGIVPGGGTAFIRASAVLAKTISEMEKTSENHDERLGYQILKKAIEEPLWHIAENAGVSGSVVVETVRKFRGSKGYNAATGEYEDMIEAGIVDPAKVTRSTVQNAASASAMLLTTEVVVAEKPEKNPPSAGGPDMSGGMPGMGM